MAVGLLVAVVAGLVLWRLWPRAAEDATPPAPPAVDAQGNLALLPAQIEALGIGSVAVDTAAHVPLAGLPADVAAPLDASARIASPWAGTVVALLVDEGGPVRAGQPVLRLRSLDVLQAQAALASARSQADAAARQAARDAQLLDEGIIAASRSEASQAQARIAAAELRRADAALAGVRLSSGEGEIELLSPIDGRVLRREVVAGQALAAQETALWVADPERLDLFVRVPLAVRDRLREGLRLQLPDGAGASVVAVGADVDPASQQLRLRARLDAPQGFVPGQRLDATLLLPAPPDAWRVPRGALLPAGAGHVLYRRDDTLFRAVRVEALLGGDADSVVVRAPGLAAGDQVVVRGTVALKALIPADPVQE